MYAVAAAATVHVPVPVIDGVAVSVAVMVWLPDFLSVAAKVCTPLSLAV